MTPVAAFLVGSAWSGAWITGKLGVGGAPPLELSAIRFVIAAIALLIVVMVTGTTLTTNGIVPIALSGLCGYVLYNALVFVGLTMAPASDGALIVPTTIPVLTAVIATFFGERLTTPKIAGLAIASLGAALVIAAGQGGADVSSRRLEGDLLMLGGAFCWATYTALGRVTLRGQSPLAVVTIASCVGALLLLPLGLFEDRYLDVATWSGGVWLDVLYLALVATVASFTVFYWIVARVGAGFASMTSYFVPVLTVLMAIAFLGDRPEPLQLAGGAVILAGVRVATLRTARIARPERAF
jgi:drug/metabolite transporter (DMT)-like permease